MKWEDVQERLEEWEPLAYIIAIMIVEAVLWAGLLGLAFAAVVR